MDKDLERLRRAALVDPEDATAQALAANAKRRATPVVPFGQAVAAFTAMAQVAVNASKWAVRLEPRKRVGERTWRLIMALGVPYGSPDDAIWEDAEDFEQGFCMIALPKKGSANRKTRRYGDIYGTDDCYDFQPRGRAVGNVFDVAGWPGAIEALMPLFI